MFGEGEEEGYKAGSDTWPLIYLPENREALPMNEKTGEEWEAYQKMLEGDFSLVKDEFWASLQSRYEESLVDGDGRCRWSYFLMDFNQDGRKELYVRFNRWEYNDTASFRYEDGQIKMWGSYASADRHGYEFPLINGKMVSVYWYQNDMERWIMRLDSECFSIREQSYDSGGEDENRFYHFQNYYSNGRPCGSSIKMSEEEYKQVEDIIDGLLIPEDAWQPCSAFTPKSDRPPIPGVG